MVYLQLFYEFFKTGLFSVGGGMATVPFLQNMVSKTGWFTFGQLADMIAVAESTPGPLGVNMATYVGYTVGLQHYGVAGGILGAVDATVGLVLPSVIVILIIARVLQKFRESKYVEAAFYGLRPASTGLIGAAGISIILIAFFRVENIYQLFSAGKCNIGQVALAAVLLYLTRYCGKTKKLHPVYFILLSAVVGVVCQFGVVA
ncbi:MAG: chromate transporter [Lachnospiraceae bacterium]|jgi:chromate transporter|nr:chromate transporter [Lachnospiraceae bacterium]